MEGAHDTCTILLHYASGLLATVKASPITAVDKQLRFWVRGQKGSYIKYDLDPQEPQIVDGMKVTDPNFGLEDVDKAGE